MKHVLNAIAWSVYLLAIVFAYALLMYSKDAIAGRYVYCYAALWLMQVHNLTILEEKC